MIYNNPKQAFAAAIAEGRLSTDPSDPHYAGNYLHLGTALVVADMTPARDTFKHADTKQYLT